MKDRQNLLHSLPIVAKALGRKYGLKVEVGGKCACTNGQTIYLPMLPADDRVSAILAHGYLDHEAGHVRLTDFGLLSRAKSPLHQALFNILEDVRVELAMGKTFPGCRGNLNRLVNQLASENFFAVPSSQDPPALVFQSFLLCRLRSSLLEQTRLVPIADLAEKMLERLVPPGLMPRLAGLMAKTSGLASTAESMCLAEEILDLLEGQSGQATPRGNSQLSGNQTEKNAGKDSSGSTKGEVQSPENADSTAPHSNPTGEQNDNSQTCGDSEEEISGLAGSDSSDNASKSPDDPGEAGLDTKTESKVSISNRTGEIIREILKADSRQLMPDLGEFLSGLLSSARSQSSNRGSTMSLTAPSPTVGTSPMLREVSSQTRALRTRLASLLEASKLERRWLRERGLRVDMRALHRTVEPRARIFRTAVPHKAIHTAVLILLDKSTSMQCRMEVARRSALALAVALESIPGTGVACAAFPVHFRHTREAVLPLTRFGEPVRQTALRYQEIQACGGTPLAAALWWGAAEILGRQEERKIILVVTDGQPDDEGSCRDIIGRCESAGIEVLGLGIELPGVQYLFRQSSVIQQLDQLAPAMFQLLESRLLRQSA